MFFSQWLISIVQFPVSLKYIYRDKILWNTCTCILDQLVHCLVFSVWSFICSLGVNPAKKTIQPESILKKRTPSTPSPQTDRLRPLGRAGAVYEVESDAESHSTGNSDNSTPIMDRRGRKPSAGSDESGGSASSLFKVELKQSNFSLIPFPE